MDIFKIIIRFVLRLSDNLGGENDANDLEYYSSDSDSDDDDDGNNGMGDGGTHDSAYSEETTGTPRCRRAKRQRRRRRRRSGTLHESMRRRFDGHNHHHHPHPHYHHPHHHHHHQYQRHPYGDRPTRVRSFHEDELRRNHRTEQEVSAAVKATDSGPKIVGTLLKSEYQRKPGLDEEICLLPPPPRRRRRHYSASTSSNDTAGGHAAIPSSSPSTAQSTPRRPQPVATPSSERMSPLRGPHVAVDTVARWSAASNSSRTTLAVDYSASGGQPLRRAMTQKLIRKRTATAESSATAADGGKRRSPLTRYGSTLGLPTQQQPRQPATPQRSANASRSSVMIRNSYRHGRIIRLEQKATKVLGVVFFTFVFLWTPFFALNLLPSVCPNCEANINKGLIDLVTWLGYASSMVNPVFYTIFNKVFRQAFKRVLMCKYRGRNKRHSWPLQPPLRKV